MRGIDPGIDDGDGDAAAGGGLLRLGEAQFADGVLRTRECGRDAAHERVGMVGLRGGDLRVGLQRAQDRGDAAAGPDRVAVERDRHQREAFAGEEPQAGAPREPARRIAGRRRPERHQHFAGNEAGLVRDGARRRDRRRSAAGGRGRGCGGQDGSRRGHLPRRLRRPGGLGAFDAGRGQGWRRRRCGLHGAARVRARRLGEGRTDRSGRRMDGGLLVRRPRPGRDRLVGTGHGRSRAARPLRLHRVVRLRSRSAQHRRDDAADDPGADPDPESGAAEAAPASAASRHRSALEPAARLREDGGRHQRQDGAHAGAVDRRPHPPSTRTTRADRHDLRSCTFRRKLGSGRSI
jgi:hypothetical protein